MFLNQKLFEAPSLNSKTFSNLKDIWPPLIHLVIIECYVLVIVITHEEKMEFGLEMPILKKWVIGEEIQMIVILGLALYKMDLR